MITVAYVQRQPRFSVQVVNSGTILTTFYLMAPLSAWPIALMVNMLMLRAIGA